MKIGIRKAWVKYAAAGLLLLGSVVWLVGVLHPLPPRILSLACGPEGSSYAVAGKQYQKLLLKQGIHLKLVITAGGVENLDLLRKGKVDVGFVEGGLANDDNEPGLEALGTLGYEPIWFFSRHVASDRGLEFLKGKRISIGPEGSASRAILLQLGKRKALDIGAFISLTLSPEDSAEALKKGLIDGAFLVNSFASPVVRDLAKTRGIMLASFDRADAFTARFPSLTKRVLPEGAADLERDLPAHPITLLAAKTCLIARAELHPALQYQMLEVISQVHSRSGIFQKAGEFPAAEELEVNLSAEAKRYYKSGRPFLQRYMPFWVAAMVEELVLLLLPLIALSYPLIKGLMAFYGWGMQRKIFRLYAELHRVETQIDRLGTGPAPKELLDRLRNMETKVRRVKVPSNYMPLLYTLRDHLASARRQIEEAGPVD